MEIQWPLALFTLLISASSGVFAGQGILILAGKGRRVQMPALVVSFVCLVAGGIASFLHLEHWERLFNGFGHITSGITQELIGVVILFIGIVVMAVLLRRTSEEDALPKWAGVMAIIVGVLMVIISAHAYDMASRVVWSTPLTAVYFFAAAFVLGASILWAVAAVCKDDEICGKLALITLIAGVCAAVAVIAFGMGAQSGQFQGVHNYFDPTTPTDTPVTSPETVANVLFGEHALLYWGGAMAVGGIVPAVLGAIGMKMREQGAQMGLAVVAAICAVGGSLAFRMAFYMMGASFFGIF